MENVAITNMSTLFAIIACIVTPPFLFELFYSEDLTPFGVLVVEYHATAAGGSRMLRCMIRRSHYVPKPSLPCRSFPELCRKSFQRYLQLATLDYRLVSRRPP